MNHHCFLSPLLSGDGQGEVFLSSPDKRDGSGVAAGKSQNPRHPTNGGSFPMSNVNRLLKKPLRVIARSVFAAKQSTTCCFYEDEIASLRSQ